MIIVRSDPGRIRRRLAASALLRQALRAERARGDGVGLDGQRRIAEPVAQGKTNREVATIPVVADRTVGSALTQIFRKLEIRSGTELARTLNRFD